MEKQGTGRTLYHVCRGGEPIKGHQVSGEKKFLRVTEREQTRDCRAEKHNAPKKRVSAQRRKNKTGKTKKNWASMGGEGQIEMNQQGGSTGDRRKRKVSREKGRILCSWAKKGALAEAGDRQGEEKSGGIDDILTLQGKGSLTHAIKKIMQRKLEPKQTTRGPTRDVIEGEKVCDLATAGRMETGSNFNARGKLALGHAL